jgi:hypothetical protein
MVHIGNTCISLQECVDYCVKSDDFVKEYIRLTGNNILSLVKPTSPINKLIDDSSGYTKDQLQKFVNFVYTTIYLPLNFPK